MRGDIDLMGRGPNFDILYHKLKVLIMLSCNYTMQFISYDSIISYRFQIRTMTQQKNLKNRKKIKKRIKRIGAVNRIM